MKRLMQLLRDNTGSERAPLNVIRAEGSNDATIYVYDVIDAYWGVNATDIAKAVAGMGSDTTLHLRINSPGGDVFEARAIAAALKGFGGKTVAHIDALAASAATTIALACDEVEIADGGFFMIHNAWTFAYGNKSDLAETISLLEKIDAGIVADYANRTGKPADEIQAWMDAETWFTAQEAVDNGFANRLAPVAEKKSSAKNWNLGAFHHAPKALTEPPGPTLDEQAAAARAHNARRLRLLELA
jgi:ATP-dependent Clp protease protease subunit